MLGSQTWSRNGELQTPCYAPPKSGCRWILSYKETTTDSSVSLACQRNKLISITSEMIADLIWDGVVAIGKTKLGVFFLKIRTRSIWSGAVMDMYLAKVPIFSIMLIGQWSSTAFLKYIQKQAQEFLHGTLSKMIKIKSFKHFQNQVSTNLVESIVGNLFALMMG